MKSVFISVEMNAGNSPGEMLITEDMELKVTSLHFANGAPLTGTSRPGAIYLQATSGAAYYLLHSPGLGQTSETFPTPMRVRAGDRMFFLPQQNGGSSDWYISLLGRAPGAAREGISVE